MSMYSLWDPTLLPELLEDRVAKNLLYTEALWYVNLDQWDMAPGMKKQFAALEKKGQKKEVRIDLTSQHHLSLLLMSWM